MYEEGQYYVYFISSLNNRALYLGVTNDLIFRVDRHKHGLGSWFTRKYLCVKLVYFEDTNDIGVAISREKELKRWRREKKNKLINTKNPEWKDLFPEILG